MSVSVRTCDVTSRHVTPLHSTLSYFNPIMRTKGDVGALAEVREELLHNVLEPIAHPERFRALGLEVPAGVLFFGPPG